MKTDDELVEEVGDKITAEADRYADRVMSELPALSHAAVWLALVGAYRHGAVEGMKATAAFVEHLKKEDS